MRSCLLADVYFCSSFTQLAFIMQLYWDLEMYWCHIPSLNEQIILMQCAKMLLSERVLGKVKRGALLGAEVLTVRLLAMTSWEKSFVK